MQDLSASQAAQATIKAAQLKKAENKRQGLEMRQAAMERITSELALLWSKFEIFMYYIHFPYFMLNREATRRNIYTQESWLFIEIYIKIYRVPNRFWWAWREGWWFSGLIRTAKKDNSKHSFYSSMPVFVFMLNVIHSYRQGFYSCTHKVQ